MRFRKSISLGKGVRLNLSKSGVSMTAGMRGLSMNIGKKGTYLNTGISGTGIYNRTRIYSKGTRTQSNSNPQTTLMEINITVNDDGSVLIKDKNYIPILDDSLLRKIKRTEAYKQKVEELMQMNKKNVEEKSNEFINIFKLSPHIVDTDYYANELQNLQIEKYQKKSFTIPQPNIENIRQDLIIYAKQNISSMKFWTIKKLRSNYVESNISSKYNQTLEFWNSEKVKFEENEAKIETARNQEYYNQYIQSKKELEWAVDGNAEYVENMMLEFLNNIQLPVDFSLQYSYSANKELSVDLDLPEIEDLPNQKATELSGGKVKIKDKTQKELKEDYIRCVIGLAIFFASHFFNISTAIKTIYISGYTQRISKKTGNLQDEYIYSIKFDRDVLKNINVNNIEPIIAVENFSRKLDITKSFEMKEIQPFEFSDPK